jgi:hypothetical protein
MEKKLSHFERWILLEAYREILKAGTDQPTKTTQQGGKVHLLRIDVVRDYFKLPVRDKSWWHKRGNLGKFRLDAGEEPMVGDKLEILLSPALKPILSEAGVQLKGVNPQLSEILDLPALIPNNHRIPGIDYRYVERTFVFTLEQKLCLIL